MPRPRIGLVVPRAGSQVPAEVSAMYPEIAFVAEGVGVTALTPEGYEAAWQNIVPTAARLAAQGVGAVMVMGASLTFHRGLAAHDALLDAVRQATGLPVGSMNSASMAGLRELGIERVAVCTAYSDEVNQCLSRFLGDAGFTVSALQGLGLERFDAPRETGAEDLVALARRVVEAAPADVQGLLLSCGGFKTLELTPRLEDLLGLPVVSSTPAAARGAAHLLGIGHALTGRGRLLGRALIDSA